MSWAIGSEQGGDLIKFLRVGAVGSFDLAIEFGGAGWKDKEAQTALPASLFKDGGELAATVHLQSTQRKRQTTL